jgi:hypothetical protein
MPVVFTLWGAEESARKPPPALTEENNNNSKIGSSGREGRMHRHTINKSVKWGKGEGRKKNRRRRQRSTRTHTSTHLHTRTHTQTKGKRTMKEAEGDYLCWWSRKEHNGVSIASLCRASTIQSSVMATTMQVARKSLLFFLNMTPAFVSYPILHRRCVDGRAVVVVFPFHFPQRESGQTTTTTPKPSVKA